MSDLWINTQCHCAKEAYKLFMKAFNEILQIQMDALWLKNPQIIISEWCSRKIKEL